MRVAPANLSLPSWWHAASVFGVLFVALLLGCGGRVEDQIKIALERSFSDAWVGCVRIAWDPAPEPPETRTRMGTCGTGHWTLDLPYVLDALTHAGFVRRLDGPEIPRRDSIFANRYELVAGFPVTRFESERGTATAVCWGDPRVRVMDIDQDRLWRLDGLYDVASAAGVDTLRLARMRKRALSVDVWYQMEVVPRPWAARLEPSQLTTLRHNSFRAPSSRSRYLLREGEETVYVYSLTVHHGDEGWFVPSLVPRRGRAIEGTSRQRVIWDRGLRGS